MENTSVSPVHHGKTAERYGFLAPALYVTIAIAIFTVVTQLLAWTGAISLSTTLLTMWLVALGLIGLLSIAYMTCRTYLTAKSANRAGPAAEKAPATAAEPERRLSEAKTATGQAPAAAAEPERWLSEAKTAAELDTKAAQEQIAQAQRDAEEQKALAEQAKAEAERARAEARKTERRVDEALKGSSSPWKDGSAGEDEDAWVPPDKLRHLDGSGRDVSTTEVFPHGCRLVPDSISPAVDNGQQVYQCRVVDQNPALKDRSPETVVNILTGQKPSPPSGPRYTLVEFEHLTLTITPYETDRSPIRMRYTLRATDIKPAVSADAAAGSASAEVDTDRLVHDNTTEEGAKAPT